MTTLEAASAAAALQRAGRRERPWNFVIILVMMFALVTLMAASYSLFAGDWNFWTDWKDRVYWPLFTAVASIFPLATIQYVGWKLFRMPLATLLAVVFMIVWMASQPLGFQGLTAFPLNFTWSATVIPVAILLDVVLVYTKGSFALTAVIGGFVFGSLFYVSNYYMQAPFLQPLEVSGKVLTLANLQGMEYHRSATPEYLRQVAIGGLHTFAGQLNAITTLFTGAICIVAYGLGLAVGRWAAIWPINRFVQRI